MFKRKDKTSHKNDEIFVDYSKDIDVKKSDEEEAIPEHYEALEIADEVVVSKRQINEAIQQKKQNDFIEHKQRETALEKEETISVTNEEIDNIEEKTDSNDDQIVVDKFKGNENNNKENKDEDLSISREDDLTDNEEKVDDPAIEDEVYNQEMNKEKEHRIYPSFLHEELSARRQMNPLDKSKEEIVDDEVSEQVESEVKVEQEIKEVQEDTHDEIQEEIQEEQEPLDDIIDDEQDNIEKKQDLHSFFGVDSSVLKQGAKKRNKIEKKQLEESAKKPLYSFKHHRFYSKEEFTGFLNDNYANLDEIAQKILNDELFFRWLKEESNQFEESIIKMKKLKQELKQ